MFNIDRGVPYGGTTHEINHFSDFLKNQSPDAVGSSNMYKWMRSAIKPYSDSVSKYFSSPTESYTKWFNTVPLLGVGAIGANKYFTNNESRN